MSNKLIYQGIKSYKKSKEYKQKKHEIYKKINNKYRILINNERSFIKRFLLFIKKKKELRNKLDKIDAKHILFMK